MRFTIAIASAFVALATAQSSSSSAASSSASTAATSTRPLTPVQSCVNACKPGDVYCQGACVGVPYPGAVQANQTTNCVADCDQGDGSAAQNQAYANCRNKCISSFILTSTLGTSDEATATAGGGFAGISGSPNAAASGGSASATTTGSGSSATGSSGSASNSGSASGSSSPSSSGSSSNSGSSSSSGSAAGSSSTGAAVSNAQITYGGLAGLVMAVLAL